MNYLIHKDYSPETPYYFYKTTNLLNGKFYYGSGSKENYIGSGVALNGAIKKYGKDNFKHERLRYFKTRQDAYNFEDRFLKLFNLRRLKKAYNLKNNGRGPDGYSHTEETKDKISNSIKNLYKDIEYYNNFCNSFVGEKNPFYGKKHTEETKHRLSESKKGIETNSLKCFVDIYGEKEGTFRFNEWNRKKSEALKGREYSEETLKLMSQKKQGVYDGEKNPMYGKQHKESSKAKMSQKKQGVFDGEKNPMYGKRGDKSPIAGTYLIEGVIISSLQNVALKYNISKKTAIRRIKSEKYPDWLKIS
jgi:group I intron endonuclease